MLDKRAGKTTLLWIPGHHMIASNEKAAACAEQAAAIIDSVPLIVSFVALRIITGKLKITPLGASEWRRESRASQYMPSWPTISPAVSQRTILEEHCLKNRAITESNVQAVPNEPTEKLPFPRETPSKHP